METSQLPQRLAEELERIGLEYFVTGSVASILYGEPRFTNDIDVVVQLPLSQVDSLIEAFPLDEFYFDAEQARLAIKRKGQFDIIHPASGFKVDLVIPAMDDFDRSRFARARRVWPGDEFQACFAAPEDVILKKLQFYAEGGSEKHLRDITGIMKITGNEIDRTYIETWAERLDVLDIWERVLESLR